MTLAPARLTSMVSGKSQNPSRKPRTASSAATRPPLAPPTPSAIAATTSRRGSGSSAPMTAAAKSSFRLRGPFSEQNPTLARTPASLSAIACSSLQLSWRPAPLRLPIAELRHPALIEEKVSTGRRGENDGQRARLAIERITPAVFAIAPPDLRFIDAGGICIDGLEIVIDRNSPSRAAVRIGASDGDRFCLRGAAACRNGRPCQGGNCRGSGAG